MSTAAKIRELRKAHHMNQMQLADMLNVSQQTLSQYENGKIEPSLSTFAKICQILRVSADEMLEIPDHSKPKISPDEFRMIDAYRNADTDTKIIIRLMLKKFMKKRGRQTTKIISLEERRKRHDKTTN